MVAISLQIILYFSLIFCAESLFYGKIQWRMYDEKFFFVFSQVEIIILQNMRTFYIYLFNMVYYNHYGGIYHALSITSYNFQTVVARKLKFAYSVRSFWKYNFTDPCPWERITMVKELCGRPDLLSSRLLLFLRYHQSLIFFLQ